MTLERIGASYLLQAPCRAMDGLVLEFGVGDQPARLPNAARVVTIDIVESYRPSVVADAHSLPFRADVFDHAVASQVFEHLHTPTRAAGELARAVRPAGSVAVATPFLYWLHQMPHDYQRFTEPGLRRLFNEHFEVQEISGYGGKLAAAWEMASVATQRSSRLRRALRAVRKRVLPPRPHAVRSRAGRLLHARVGDHPLGYLTLLRVRSGAAARPPALGPGGTATSVE